MRRHLPSSTIDRSGKPTTKESTMMLRPDLASAHGNAVGTTTSCVDGYVVGLRALRERLAGQIVLPGEGDWDAARQAWNLAVDQQPLAVAIVESAEDVGEVVRFARTHRLRIAPQGTGHGACSLPTLDDTILLRLSLLRGVDIDVTARRVRVGAGALWGDVVEPAAAQ